MPVPFKSAPAATRVAWGVGRSLTMGRSFQSNNECDGAGRYLWKWHTREAFQQRHGDSYRNNTYSGTTTISAGTLQIGDGGASGTPGTGDVIDNGTLNINRGTDAVIPNQISGTGELARIAPGSYN